MHPVLDAEATYQLICKIKKVLEAVDQQQDIQFNGAHAQSDHKRSVFMLQATAFDTDIRIGVMGQQDWSDHLPAGLSQGQAFIQIGTKRKVYGSQEHFIRAIAARLWGAKPELALALETQSDALGIPQDWLAIPMRHNNGALHKYANIAGRQLRAIASVMRLDFAKI